MGGRRFAAALAILAASALLQAPLDARASEWWPSDGTCGDKGPWMEGMCHTDSDGNENEHCRPCLVGAEWDEVRARLGTELARGRRTTVPTVKYAERLSQTLASSAFRIILKELLGYEVVRTATTNSLHEVEETASQTCQAINLEVWPTEGAEEHPSVLQAYNGAAGKSGLFMPDYAPSDAMSYRSLVSSIGAKYMKQFPPDGSIFDIDRINQEFPGGDPWGCNETESKWTVSKCTAGRWYPSACGDTYPSPNCYELYISNQYYSAGRWESVIENLELNFSVVYTSNRGFQRTIKELFEQKRMALFYWWTPDPLISKYRSVPFTLPGFTEQCRAAKGRDPKQSLVDCDSQITSLQKMMNAKQAITDPDIYHLWYAWNLGIPELDKLMTYQVEGGGQHSSPHDAACQWLKDSATSGVKWLEWVQISDPCAGSEPPLVFDETLRTCVPPSLSIHQLDSGLASFPWWWVMFGVGGLLLAAGLLVLGLKLRAALIIKEIGPPGQGPQVTLVITDIQGGTELWNQFPDEVAQGIKLHQQCLRANLCAYNGYEVSAEGETFKCAFATPEDAICWSIAIQLDLLAAPWSHQIEDGGLPRFAADETWPSLSELPASSRDDCFPLNFITNSSASRATAKPHNPFFPVNVASATTYSTLWRDKSPYATVAYGESAAMLPIFRGLLVRVGIHTGTADVVGVHHVTKRITYGGKVASIAKAVAETACGGQIIMSGETMAAITSVQDLMDRVSVSFKSWSSGLDSEAKGRSSVSFVHCSSHLLSPVQSRSLMLSSVSSPLPKLLSVLSRERSRSSNIPSAKSSPSVNLSALSGSDSRFWELPHNTLEHKLDHVHELVMVIPWALRARTRCFPPLNSLEAVTPSYFDAPSGANTTIMFCFIQGWSALKTEFFAAQEILRATQRQYALIIRRCLLEHRGYEIEGEDDSFVCAFHTAIDATECAVQVQKELRESQWDPALLQSQHCEPVLGTDSGILLHGPRAKIGMCTGNAHRSQPCLRTGRRTYTGSFMNQAARVAAAAPGGLVVLHAQTFQALRQEPPAPSISVVHWKDVKLKGFQKEVGLYRAREAWISDEGLEAIMKELRMSLTGMPLVMRSLLESDTGTSEITVTSSSNQRSSLSSYDGGPEGRAGESPAAIKTSHAQPSAMATDQ